MRELLLGGQKSGKSRVAESRALDWLATCGHEAVLVATAIAGDAEMAERIARHRTHRAARIPGLRTAEEPHAVTEMILGSNPQCMVIVDCITLWLTQLMLPLSEDPASDREVSRAIDTLVAAVVAASGPIVLVSNEIGLGVTPLSREARRFVDTLGSLHQAFGAVCERVTLMVAGCELCVRDTTAMTTKRTGRR